MKQISLYKVSMSKNVIQKLEEVLYSGFVTEGEVSKEFEKKFGEFINNPNTALLNSGTSALTLALRLAGVGPDTNVIASPMTCLATTMPVVSLGGKIIWCDVDPLTGNIDPECIPSLITDKTKAILFVDWGGTPAELERINEIAQQYGIKTIEDAAQSLGAKYKGHLTGTLCDFVCFSFQAIKHLTTVDGGALACKLKSDYERAVLLRWFGLRRGHNKCAVCWEGDVPEYGYKFHMNNVNAAIGLANLEEANDRILTHRRNGELLRSNLKDLDGLEMCRIPSYIESSFWFLTVLLKDLHHKGTFSQKLFQKGIANNISHTRNDNYSLFKEFKRKLPGLDSFSDRMLNIPCGWWVDENDIEYISQAVKECI